MPIRRITISVPEETANRIRRAAGAKPISTWVTGVIEEHLDDAELERLWREFCEGVRPARAEARRARAMFKRLTKPARRRGAA